MILRSAPASEQALKFIVYSRRGCGCCDRALALLRDRQKLHRFSIDLVDIDTDPDLKERFGSTVPVIALNGKERFRGKVEPMLLDRLLEAESRRGGRG